ncbi:MAG: manganese efflux pump MntP family protein [Sulfuricurvum sp.]|uniref:manganese efflux pump MntP n=1 Tax=Sulfuricurvum sp. TaxID=2025608 RepID=UPI002722208A|nr:manganese efflux pump MntP family protein [Sulfuricurvum sp.]MDO9057001.1 manganese efflux pump MntP family protein [Sulfuricurvum sp.]MDP2849706.1 manganese efflux pump MntP family protein [Sulfuricurvum sp.]MDP3291705.1 manganese efflux pump MntP family protein [Sulfuricurvum sp.]
MNETLLILAVALAMDSVAVSIAIGSKYKDLLLSKAFFTAAVFGFFQGAMPIAGYFIGISFADYVQAFDHWIAFVLLVGLGGKMLYEAYKNEFDEEVTDLSAKTLITLGIATSIDAMAIGVTFAFLQTDIYSAAGVIALVTFVLCVAAVYVGKKLGSLLESKAEMLGGLILIGLGTKILLEHLEVL